MYHTKASSNLMKTLYCQLNFFEHIYVSSNYCPLWHGKVVVLSKVRNNPPNLGFIILAVELVLVCKFYN